VPRDACPAFLDFAPVTWEDFDIVLNADAAAAAEPLITALRETTVQSSLDGLGAMTCRELDAQVLLPQGIRHFLPQLRVLQRGVAVRVSRLGTACALRDYVWVGVARASAGACVAAQLARNRRASSASEPASALGDQGQAGVGG
jgi:hypothetical protein